MGIAPLLEYSCELEYSASVINRFNDFIARPFNSNLPTSDISRVYENTLI